MNSVLNSTRNYLYLLTLFGALIILAGLFLFQRSPDSSTATAVLAATMSLGSVLLATAINNLVQSSINDRVLKQARLKQERELRHKDKLMNLDFEHQMRLAAIDKRLDAHQQAYTHWWHLLWNVHHTKGPSDQVDLCQEWWSENCLYLSPAASQAFRQAYLAAVNHKGYVDSKKHDRSPQLTKLVEDNWAKIEGAGDIIARSAGLPEFGAKPDELESVRSTRE